MIKVNEPIHINELNEIAESGEYAQNFEELQRVNSNTIFKFSTEKIYLNIPAAYKNEIPTEIYGFKLSDKMFIFPYRDFNGISETKEVSGPRLSNEKFNPNYLQSFNAQKKFINDAILTFKRINEVQLGQSLLNDLQTYKPLLNINSNNVGNILREYESIKFGYEDILGTNHESILAISGTKLRGMDYNQPNIINRERAGLLDDTDLFSSDFDIFYKEPHVNGMGTSSIVGFDNELTLGKGTRIFSKDALMFHELCHVYNTLTGSSGGGLSAKLSNKVLTKLKDISPEEYLVTGGDVAQLIKESQSEAGLEFIYITHMEELMQKRYNIINNYEESVKGQYEGIINFVPHKHNEIQYFENSGRPPIRENYIENFNKVAMFKLHKLYRVNMNSINENYATNDNQIPIDYKVCLFS